MTERSSESFDGSTNPYLLCGAFIQDSRSPRHWLILEDKSEITVNRRAGRRVYPECWERGDEPLMVTIVAEDSAL